MDSSQQQQQRNSGSNTLPSLSISTSTSCASSVLSTSPITTTDSPYYYYTCPTSASCSPTTIAHPSSFRQSHRSLERRAHSASVRLPRRTYSPAVPPQRSASAGSTLLKDSLSVLPSSYRTKEIHINDDDDDDDDPFLRHSITTNTTTTSMDHQQGRWDDSQLAMELADDLPSSPTTTLSTRENLKIKVRQWINTKQQHQGNRRRPIHKWFSDRLA